MTRTPLNDDVLRGLRGGAILLAVLAIGIGGYRLMRESPPVPPDPPPSPASAPPPRDTVEKPADEPSIPTTGSRPNPPPPPARAKPVRKNVSRHASTENVLNAEPFLKSEDAPAVSNEKASATESADEKEVDRSAEKASDPGDLGCAPALNENAAKQESRGKRWIKAVGRWLGIGKKPSAPAGP
jgi:type IV secretory pathway VirB10-like protein